MPSPLLQEPVNFRWMKDHRAVWSEATRTKMISRRARPACVPSPLFQEPVNFRRMKDHRAVWSEATHTKTIENKSNIPALAAYL